MRALEGKELASWKLAPGDIFLQLKNGRVMRLKRAGDLLDQPFVEKFGNKGGLLYLNRVHLKRVGDIAAYWEHIQDLNDPEQLASALDSFCDVVRAGLHSEGGLNLIDWSFACYQMFRVPDQIQSGLLETHQVLHYRALYISALSVLFAFGCGYRDPTFIRELYQTAWLMDGGFVSPNFTYWTALACQVEKETPGAGLEFLKSNKASEKEQQLFVQHPELGHQLAVDNFGKQFKHPALFDIISRHHELADGRGFPAGLTISVLSDWEAILILADQLIDYREEVIEGYANEGLRGPWEALRRLPMRDLPIQRIIRKISLWSLNLRAVKREVSA